MLNKNSSFVSLRKAVLIGITASLLLFSSAGAVRAGEFSIIDSIKSFFGIEVDSAVERTAEPMNNAAQPLPFTQNWTDNGLITANDNWSGVLGIEGYFLNSTASPTGVDPQTILDDTFGGAATTVDLDVIANLTDTTNTSGGVGEFHTTSQTTPSDMTNSVVGLQGSGTADAPFLLININTTGQSGITVSYVLRDIDCTVDNAIQPVVLQYRVGNTGNYENIAGSFVADATQGPSLCTQVTISGGSLPATANNRPLVQLRIMTTNAIGSDEWVGIDNISITTGGVTPTPTATATPAGSPTPTATATPVASPTPTVAPSPTVVPTPSPTVAPSPTPATQLIINEVDADTAGVDTLEFIELFSPGFAAGPVSLNGFVVVLYNGSNDLSYLTIDLNGRTTSPTGYFTIGNADVPGVDLVVPGDSLQNGADAVALFVGAAADFPVGTPIRTQNLRDALVYDTADPDDAGLLALLNPGQPQIDENGNLTAATVSMQRCPNASGGERNTSSYLINTPTPDTVNNCVLPTPTPTPTVTPTPTPSPTPTPAATVSIGGRVFTPSGLGIRNAVVILTDSAMVRRTATTSSFGVYSFENIRPGETYTLNVASKRYRFTPLTMPINANMVNVDFTGLE